MFAIYTKEQMIVVLREVSTANIIRAYNVTVQNKKQKN